MICPLPSDPNYKHFEELKKAIGGAAAQSFFESNGYTLPRDTEEVEAIISFHEESKKHSQNLKEKDAQRT
jgi:hypothetical protein